MYAIVQRSEEQPRAGLLPIAGRPLIARQLQWLRTIGCEGIAVELGADEEGAAIERFLRRDDALGTGVLLVVAERRSRPRETAARAGFPAGAPLLVLPADLLCGGDPTALAEGLGSQSALLRAPPPPGLEALFTGGEPTLVGAGEGAPLQLEFEGWSARLPSLRHAMLLGAAALDGRLGRRPEDPSWGIQIHAAERSPGVWIARGALVEPGAVLVGPVLIGRDAVVRAGAQVGPRAVVGERAVIETGVKVVDGMVTDGTIAGVGLSLRAMVAEPSALLDLESGLRVEVPDALLLSRREAIPALNLVTRTLGLMLLVLFAPILRLVLAPFVLGALPRLLGMALGTRALLGATAWTEAPSTEVPAMVDRQR